MSALAADRLITELLQRYAIADELIIRIGLPPPAVDEIAVRCQLFEEADSEIFVDPQTAVASVTGH